MNQSDLAEKLTRAVRALIDADPLPQMYRFVITMRDRQGNEVKINRTAVNTGAAEASARKLLPAYEVIKTELDRIAQ